MTDKLLTGLHAIKSQTGNYHAVAVYLDMCQDFVKRYGLLLNEEPFEDLNEILDDMDLVINEDLLSALCTSAEKELDQLVIYHPNRDQIGQVVQGTLVGWHLDYKRNKKKRGPSVVLTNAALMIDGAVHFVCIDKFEVMDENMDSETFKEVVESYMQTIRTAYRLGDDMLLDIVPLGKNYARYTLKEHIPGPTWWEIAMGGIHETADPEVGKKLR